MNVEYGVSRNFPAKLLNGQHGSKLVFAPAQNSEKEEENGWAVGCRKNFGRVGAHIRVAGLGKTGQGITFDSK
jgi:hypothetical protein